MPMKHFGIYLSYPPTVDLRKEGLGRYLVSFLKGAVERTDVRFVILCPSWSLRELEIFFDGEGVPRERYDICAPQQKPLVMRGYEAYLARKSRPRKISIRERLANMVRNARDSFLQRIEARMVRVVSLSDLPPLILGFIALLAVALILALPVLIAVLFSRLISLLQRGISYPMKPLRVLGARVRGALDNPKYDGLVLRLYQGMALAETKRMLKLIDDLQHVRAWYCTTAFWPAFNDIPGPKLRCVPDMVLAEFPVSFADQEVLRTQAAFEAVESSIRGGQHFVTYSETIKWGTLVERYGVHASNISVIHHAPNDLSRWVNMGGFDDTAAASLQYCKALLGCALQKSSNPSYTGTFFNNSFKFLFYASQFRPNKNLISLLRAYKSLLCKRLIGYKLVLTGNPVHYPIVQNFIAEHALENDVLCLHGLTIQELAACYKLADLAVNPSLSEGGCPFTFAEALSVDTPVVMARIPVTEEVLTDPELQEMTFFDPYDWEDIAYRIEWGVNHREELLSMQSKTFVELKKRSWTHVVNEHIEVLDQISTSVEVGENEENFEKKQ